MARDLPFDVLLLFLRIGFVLLIYLFLFMVVRVLLRDLRHSAGISAAAEPPGRLVVVASGDQRGRDRAFSLATVTTIGRHSSCTIALDDEFVSGEHAALRWRDGAWWIEDVASTNGTFVNGLQLDAPTRLRFGDLIEIGNVRLELAP